MASAPVPEALPHDHVFEPAGADTWMPTPIACGPWSPEALHGGPPTALVGRAIMAHEPGETDWLLSRLTVELIKPVPLAPLRVRVENRRPGRRVQVLDAVLETADGTEVLWARGLRLAQVDNGFDESTVANPAPPTWPEPTSLPRWKLGIDSEWLMFGSAYEFRLVRGAPFREEGPAALWGRLRLPLFAGEDIHPLDRLLTLADFPNGFGNAVPYDRFTYINPDLTVSTHRLPEGEWLLMDALMHPRATGVGVATGAIFDATGPVATATQSLLITAR